MMVRVSFDDSGRRRGELRIYLGAAPGVGKTCAMLGEGHRRQGRGTDVVAAVVETHGRRKVVELLAGIETVAAPDAELDIAAVLQRRPQVVLIDDLAHRNPPASRNHSRWQDIDELLDAGITVISTVNIAQLESLSDLAARITGIREPETVPDCVVRRAAQVELVDITPEALRRRLSHGNVYAPEHVDAQLTSYFRSDNLAALRELSLLWLTGQVDRALDKYRTVPTVSAEDSRPARERVVVAVTGRPGSEAMVRQASRIAAKSDAELMVLHVLRDAGFAGTSAAWLGKIRDLATGVGGSLHTVVGDDVPTALLDFAREMNATALVIGTSHRSRWARIFTDGVGAAVVQQSGDIDVHMVGDEGIRPRFRAGPVPPRQRRAVSWLAALAVPVAVCAVAVAWLDPILDTDGESALFFVGVLIVALLGGIAPAALSALLSGVLLNYFLIDPRYDFTIDEPDAAITELVLLLVAVAVAVLVDGAAKRAREAGRASNEAELLTQFAGSVLRGADLETLLEKVRETYSQRAVSILRKRPGRHPATEVVASVGADPCFAVAEADSAIDVGDDEFWMLLAGHQLAARDRRVLSAVANQAAGLIRQHELVEEASRTQTVMRADELRRSLLSAVSHDLRTPLAGAKAAVSSLRAVDVDFSPEDTGELLATIEESIDQLTALVGNLLDSSRLAAGAVRPALTEVYLEEVVQRALVSIGKGSTVFDRGSIDQVKVEVGPTVAMADAGLLERVLANVIHNALRYAPDSVVRVSAGRAGDRVRISVADEGGGVPRGGAEHMFAPFQRLGDRDNTSGVGLGLSVARGFVEAMGGTIEATDTPGGGLTMVVELAAPAERG